LDNFIQKNTRLDNFILYSNKWETDYNGKVRMKRAPFW
jgi:hypothetical protein